MEVGTFTGTSAVAIARGLARAAGCCAATSARSGRRSPGGTGRRPASPTASSCASAPALDTLRGLPQDQPVDFAFVDADKGGYVDYYEALVPRLRTGGLLVADNVLWSGRVVDPDATDDDTEAIRRFNDHVAADDRCRRGDARGRRRHHALSQTVTTLLLTPCQYET